MKKITTVLLVILMTSITMIPAHAEDTTLTGIIDTNGSPCYYVNGKLQSNVTDVVYTSYLGDYGWYNIMNGRLVQNDTVAHNSNGWWYCRGGKVDFGYTGVWNNANGWWRIEDGKVNFDFEGLAGNCNGIWYCKGGKVQFNVTDILYTQYLEHYSWWNIKNGQLVLDEVVAHNSNGWWYCHAGGEVDFTYTGVKGNENGWWKIEDGKVNFNFEGLADNQNGTWYCKGGKVQFNVTDVLYTSYNGVNGWWNIIGGKLKKEENVAHNANGWWYIGEDGKVDFDYTGIAANENGAWYLENGRVDFSYNGTYGDKEIINGKVQNPVSAYEAYSVFLESIKDKIYNPNVILPDNYDWKVISFYDVTGDGVPELFCRTVEPQSPGFPYAYLIYTGVYTCQYGKVTPLLDPVLSMNAVADPEYHMYFTVDDSDNLYLLRYSGNMMHKSYILLYEYSIDGVSPKVVFKEHSEYNNKELCEQYGWETFGEYKINGESVDENTVLEVNKGIFNNISRVISHYSVHSEYNNMEEQLSTDSIFAFNGKFSDFERIAMTFDEAMEYLSARK